MSDVSAVARIGWHATLWFSAASALAILKSRLAVSFDSRTRDTAASDTIVRHFECAWEEGLLLRQTLRQDLHRKLEGFFEVERLMGELENVGGSAAEARVISRMLVDCYSGALLTDFIAVAMAIVGKTLYLRSLLKDHSASSADDLSAANRIFICLAPRFVQHGTVLLAESIRNAVRAVFGKVSLQEPTSRVLLDSLISQVRHEIETSCGKSILDDCIFDKLDELISADLAPTRRRLFIAMVTESRRRLKSEHLKALLSEQVSDSLSVMLGRVFSTPSETPQPLLLIIPRVSRLLRSANEMTVENKSLRMVAAALFVDCDSDVQNCMVYF
ncbi:hypothetical protein PSACC_01310 [Paramicrosporidium saccamoebae]|uniref:Uncharacterized protein n=1 Tax=Paramicrosporidium saccamoebae TaxID=1246581 RepID=A0A2H9TMB4_9FUNG|nr:hypothetical protein PSACC_01310 [Paramicrosporidium saccamoebae]